MSILEADEFFYETNLGSSLPFGLLHVEISVEQVSARDRSLALGGSSIGPVLLFIAPVFTA